MEVGTLTGFLGRETLLFGHASCAQRWHTLSLMEEEREGLRWDSGEHDDGERGPPSLRPAARNQPRDVVVTAWSAEGGTNHGQKGGHRGGAAAPSHYRAAGSACSTGVRHASESRSPGGPAEVGIDLALEEALDRAVAPSRMSVERRGRPHRRMMGGRGAFGASFPPASAPPGFRSQQDMVVSMLASRLRAPSSSGRHDRASRARPDARSDAPAGWLMPPGGRRAAREGVRDVPFWPTLGKGDAAGCCMLLQWTTVLEVTPPWLDYCQYDRSQIVGRTLRMLQGPLTNQADVKRLMDDCRNRVPCKITLINYKSDMTPFYNTLHVHPIGESCFFVNFAFSPYEGKEGGKASGQQPAIADSGADNNEAGDGDGKSAGAGVKAERRQEHEANGSDDNAENNEEDKKAASESPVTAAAAAASALRRSREATGRTTGKDKRHRSLSPPESEGSSSDGGGGASGGPHGRSEQQRGREGAPSDERTGRMEPSMYQQQFPHAVVQWGWGDRDRRAMGMAGSIGARDMEPRDPREQLYGPPRFGEYGYRMAMQQRMMLQLQQEHDRRRHDRRQPRHHYGRAPGAQARSSKARKLPLNVVRTAKSHERYGVKLTFGNHQLRVGSSYCDVESAAIMVRVFKTIMESPRPRVFTINPVARAEAVKQGEMVSVYDRWKRTRCRVTAVAVIEEWMQKHAQRHEEQRQHKRVKQAPDQSGTESGTSAASGGASAAMDQAVVVSATPVEPAVAVAEVLRKADATLPVVAVAPVSSAGDRAPDATTG